MEIEITRRELDAILAGLRAYEVAASVGFHGDEYLREIASGGGGHPPLSEDEAVELADLLIEQAVGQGVKFSGDQIDAMSG